MALSGLTMERSATSVGAYHRPNGGVYSVVMWASILLVSLYATIGATTKAMWQVCPKVLGITEASILTSSDTRLLLPSTSIAHSDCNEIRVEPFRAKLELTYLYSVEVVETGVFSVEGVQDAIVHELVSAFSECDGQGRAKYGVDISAKHVESEEECHPLDERNACHVVIGTSKIALDDDAKEVNSTAYKAINTALEDVSFLQLFAPDVHSARLIISIQDSLFVSVSDVTDSKSRSGMTIVASSAAGIFVLLVAIMTCGTVRRQTSKSVDSLPRRSADVATPSPLGIKRVEAFDRMMDDDPGLFHVAFDSEEPSNTWSVSDITSESGSSVRSMTPSKLAKIDEESCEDEPVTPISRKDSDVESKEDSSGTVRELDHQSMLSFWRLDASAEERADDRSASEQLDGPVLHERESAEIPKDDDPMLSVWQLDSDTTGIEQSAIDFAKHLDDVDGSPGSFHTASSGDIEVVTVTSEESIEHQTDRDFSAYDIQEELFVTADGSSLDISSYTTDSEQSMKSWLVQFLHEISRRTPMIQS